LQTLLLPLVPVLLVLLQIHAEVRALLLFAQTGSVVLPVQV